MLIALGIIIGLLLAFLVVGVEIYFIQRGKSLIEWQETAIKQAFKPESIIIEPPSPQIEKLQEIIDQNEEAGIETNFKDFLE